MLRFLPGFLCLFIFALPVFGAEMPGSAGIQVVPIQSGELVVIAIVPGSSAESAGVRPGDMLVKIDDKVLRGSDFERVAQTVLPGAAGTSLLLTWMRPGEPGIRTARVKRLPLDPAKVPPSDIPTAGPQ